MEDGAGKRPADLPEGADPANPSLQHRQEDDQQYPRKVLPWFGTFNCKVLHAYAVHRTPTSR